MLHHSQWHIAIQPNAAYANIVRLQQKEGPAADFMIEVEGQEWPVHKLVLFCHSDVLYKMSTNAAFTECQTGRVVLKGFEPRCVEAMVHFLYNQTYTDIRDYPYVMNDKKSHMGDKEDGSDEGNDEHKTRSEDDGDDEAGEIPEETHLSPEGSAIEFDRGSGWSSSPEFDESDHAQLKFDIGMCVLAECYNVKGLRLAAEVEIKQHLENAQGYANLSSIVDTILDSHVPKSMRTNLVTALVHKTEFLHSKESDSLLDRRPELAVAILKKVAERRHAKHLRDQALERGCKPRKHDSCYGGSGWGIRPLYDPLCDGDAWPEGS